MLNIKKVQTVPLQQEEGRAVRYVLQPADVIVNDPFVILADDTFSHHTFSEHPHKGIQTVTYVIEGNIEHTDSKTGKGRLYEGDFQLMTAGRGIIHNEAPELDKQARVLQLWVNLSGEHKKLAPHYEDLPFSKVPYIAVDGGRIEIYAGEVEGVASPLHLYTPFLYVVVTLETGHEYNLPVPAHYNSFAYMLEGEALISGNSMEPYEIAHFETNNESDFIRIQATASTKLVIFSGLPIQEPIVVRGPFVMNTEREIIEAYSSYRKGTFLDDK